MESSESRSAELPASPPAKPTAVFLPSHVPLIREVDHRAEMAELRRHRRRRLLVRMALGVVLPGLAALGIWKAVEWRQRAGEARLLDLARAAKDGGDLPLARQQLQAAARASEEGVRLAALRELASPAIHEDRERLPWLQELALSTGSTEAEQKQLVELALRLRQPVRPVLVVDRWLADPAVMGDWERAGLCADYFLQTWRLDEGLAWARRGQIGGGESGAADLAAGRLERAVMTDSPEEARRQIARASGLCLRALRGRGDGAEEGPAPEAALREMAGALTGVPGFKEGLGESGRAWLRERSKGWLEAAQRERQGHRMLAAATVHYQLMPTAERAAFVEEWAGRLEKGTVEDRRAWASWLLQNGLAERAATVIKQDPVSGDDEAALWLRVAVLAAAGQWAEVEVALREQRVVSQESLPVRLQRWRLLRERGTAVERQRSARQEVLAAARQAAPQDVLGAADSVLGWGDTAFACELYRMALPSAEAQARAARGLWLALREVPQAESEVLEALRMYAAAAPWDDAAAADLLWLEVLNGAGTAQSEADARALLERQPGSWRRRATLALVLLLRDKVEESVCVLPARTEFFPSLTVPLRIRVMESCLKAAAGDRRQAKAMAADLPTASLRPGEQQLLSRFGLFW